MLKPGLLVQGCYLVVQELGKGGFAQTFEVDDNGTHKVLKVLINNYPKAVSLFQREAQVLKQLNHPGIPRVELDGYFTWLQDGKPPCHCLVMEKIEGRNLAEWLVSKSNQPITQEQAVYWLKQLVEILQQLHQQQYFHRDIKPSNIMLKPDGQLVLIDFGAVRQVTESYLQQQAANVTGTRIGSAGYQPPEQADGHAVPQSDFFALGRTFVHLLTGKHPIHLRNPQTLELNWREFAPQITDSLADLLDDMIALVPSARPKNTLVIGQRLAEMELTAQTKSSLVSQKVEPVSLTELKKKRKTINLVSLLKSIGLNCWLALLLLLRLLGWRSLLPKLEVTFNNRGVDNHLANRLVSAKIYYQCALLIKPDYMKAHYNLGSLYEKQGKYPQATAEYQIAMQGNISAAFNNFARLQIVAKQYTVAVDLLKERLSLDQNQEIRYALLKNLGWALLKQQRYSEAKGYLQEAIELKSDRAAAYGVLAQVLEAQGDQHKARAAWDNFWRYAPNDHSPEVDAWMMIAP